MGIKTYTAAAIQSLTEFNALPEVKATGRVYGKYVKFICGYVLEDGRAFFVGRASDGLYILNECTSYSCVCSSPFREVLWSERGFKIGPYYHSRSADSRRDLVKQGLCVTTADV